MKLPAAEPRGIRKSQIPIARPHGRIGASGSFSILRSAEDLAIATGLVIPAPEGRGIA